MTDSAKFFSFGNFLIPNQFSEDQFSRNYRGCRDIEINDKTFSMKIFFPQHSENEIFKQSLYYEMKMALSLSHPNIPKLLRGGIINNLLFVKMEDSLGENLQDCLKKLSEIKKLFPIEMSTYIISQVCKGLHYAHSLKTEDDRKIVHLDIRPYNIILNYDGFVKITGFGIAQLKTDSDDTGIMGQTSYLAPEFLEGVLYDNRFDQFSLGVVLWELLCGRKLFMGEDEANILKQIRKCDIPTPSSINPNIPKELDEIVLMALSKNRLKRFKNLDQMNDALTQFALKNYPKFEPVHCSHLMNKLFEEEIKNNILFLDNETRLFEKAKNAEISIIDDIRVDLVKTNNAYEYTPLHLLALADPSDLLIVRKILEHPSVDKVVDKNGNTPLHYLAETKNLSSAELVLRHPSISTVTDSAGNTPLHCFWKTESLDIAEKVLQHPSVAEVQNNNNGRTPLHYFCETKSSSIAAKVLKHPSVDKAKDCEGRTTIDLIIMYDESRSGYYSERPSGYHQYMHSEVIAANSADKASTAMPDRNVTRPDVTGSYDISGSQCTAEAVVPHVSCADIRDELELSLRGMVCVDDFIKNFSFELEAFRDKKTKSRGVVLWGNSSVGKTEIAKRICGLTNKSNSPINIHGIKFKYIACCDEDVSPKDIVASVEDGTVVFLDEVDKYLSLNSGISSAAQAKGLRTSLMTNFNSKAIFWVFTGTFVDIRGVNNLTIELLGKALGAELSTRIDFVGWKLKDWTLVSIMKAAKLSSLSIDKNIEYEEEALLALCEYALKHGGGIRALERSHESIKRMNQDRIGKDKAKIVFTKDLVINLIKQENGVDV